MRLHTEVSEYEVVDENLNSHTFENFENAFKIALELTDENRAVFISLPDGRRFSLLECPKVMR